ncbi:histone deacetylase hdac5 [Cystoisospora suis]|uniref:Histone deacetylase hdac5 n=1 Tax=Cystoisospora suis TaxID=483139 RepID=A0A2C6KPW2_9APIC|nr:histone deacetylase hdac5 [Cystoisospora suis]
MEGQKQPLTRIPQQRDSSPSSSFSSSEFWNIMDESPPGSISSSSSSTAASRGELQSCSSLHKLIATDSVRGVRLWLSNPFCRDTINDLNHAGETPLHIALQRCNPRILSMLLDPPSVVIPSSVLEKCPFRSSSSSSTFLCDGCTSPSSSSSTSLSSARLCPSSSSTAPATETSMDIPRDEASVKQQNVSPPFSSSSTTSSSSSPGQSSSPPIDGDFREDSSPSLEDVLLAQKLARKEEREHFSLSSPTFSSDRPKGGHGYHNDEHTNFSTTPFSDMFTSTVVAHELSVCTASRVDFSIPLDGLPAIHLLIGRTAFQDRKGEDALECLKRILLHVNLLRSSCTCSRCDGFALSKHSRSSPPSLSLPCRDENILFSSSSSGTSEREVKKVKGEKEAPSNLPQQKATTGGMAEGEEEEKRQRLFGGKSLHKGDMHVDKRASSSLDREENQNTSLSGQDERTETSGVVLKSSSSSLPNLCFCCGHQTMVSTHVSEKEGGFLSRHVEMSASVSSHMSTSSYHPHLCYSRKSFCAIPRRYVCKETGQFFFSCAYYNVYRKNMYDRYVSENHPFSALQNGRGRDSSQKQTSLGAPVSSSFQTTQVSYFSEQKISSPSGSEMSDRSSSLYDSLGNTSSSSCSPPPRDQQPPRFFHTDATDSLFLDLHAKDSQGRTALHIACNVGVPQVVELLLHSGVSPYIRTSPHGELPLHSCIDADNESSCLLLLKHTLPCSFFFNSTCQCSIQSSSSSVSSIPTREESCHEREIFPRNATEHRHVKDERGEQQSASSVNTQKETQPSEASCCHQTNEVKQREGGAYGRNFPYLILRRSCVALRFLLQLLRRCIRRGSWKCFRALLAFPVEPRKDGRRRDTRVGGYEQGGEEREEACHLPVVDSSTSLASSTIQMKEKEDVTMKDDKDDGGDGSVDRKSFSSSPCTVLHALLEVEGREGLNVLISQARRCGSIHELYRHFQLAVEQDIMHSHTCCIDALREIICDKEREALSKTHRRSQEETARKDVSFYQVKNEASSTCTPDGVSMGSTIRTAGRALEVEREEEEGNPFLQRRTTMDGSFKEDNTATLIVSHPLCLEHLPLPEPTDMPLKRFKLMQRFPENPSRLEVLTSHRCGILRTREFSRLLWLEDPPPASLSDILRVHSMAYIARLRMRVEDAFGITTRLPSLPVSTYPFSSSPSVPRDVTSVSSSSLSNPRLSTVSTTASLSRSLSSCSSSSSSSSSVISPIVSDALYAGARALQVDLRLQKEQLDKQRKQQIQMVGLGGRFSFVFADGDTPVTCFSWTAAVHAAGSVIAAVDAVCEGRCRNAFCAVRPPGHHLGNWGAAQTSPSTKLTDEDMAAGSQGFCLLNNVAIGASYAKYNYSRKGIRRIAVVDFDVHHGNGTEQIIRNVGMKITKVKQPANTSLLLYRRAAEELRRSMTSGYMGEVDEGDEREAKDKGRGRGVSSSSSLSPDRLGPSSSSQAPHGSSTRGSRGREGEGTHHPSATDEMSSSGSLFSPSTLYHPHGNESLGGTGVGGCMNVSLPVDMPQWMGWRDERDAEELFFASIHAYDGSFYPGTGADCEDYSGPTVINVNILPHPVLGNSSFRSSRPCCTCPKCSLRSCPGVCVRTPSLPRFTNSRVTSKTTACSEMFNDTSCLSSQDAVEHVQSGEGDCVSGVEMKSGLSQRCNQNSMGRQSISSVSCFTVEEREKGGREGREEVTTKRGLNREERKEIKKKTWRCHFCRHPSLRPSSITARRLFLQRVIRPLLRFSPDLIFVSAGFDGHRQDQIGGAFGGFAEEDFRFFTHQLVRTAERCCEGRVVSVLEGGYSVTGGVSSALAASVKEHLRGMLRTAAGTTRCLKAVTSCPDSTNERGPGTLLKSNGQSRPCSTGNSKVDIAEAGTARGSFTKKRGDGVDMVSRYHHMDVAHDDGKSSLTSSRGEEENLETELVCLRKQCEDFIIATEEKNQRKFSTLYDEGFTERDGRDITMLFMEHDPEVGDSAVSEVTASDAEECWYLLNDMEDV